MISAVAKVFAEFGLKIAASFAPIVVRRFYKVDLLQAGIKIRVIEAHRGIYINCGELPQFQAWLRITNLTPFDLTFDRLYGQLHHGCQLAEFQSLERRVVPTRSEKEFMVSANLAPDHVAFIRRNLARKFQTHLNVSGFVQSRLHDFEINGREAHAANVELVNCVAIHPPETTAVSS
jgi:hypothetical protein